MHLLRSRTCSLAAVLRHENLRGREIHTILVARIDTHLRVVERTRVRVVHLGPRLPGVGCPIESVGRRRARRLVAAVLRCVRRLDHGIHIVGIAQRDRETDASLRPFGEAVTLDLRPRRAAVGGLEKSGAGPARLERIRRAQSLPRCGIQDLWVPRVHRDVDEAGFVADVLDELPALAAVGRLVESPLRICLPRRAERGDVYRVRVARMHDDATDMLCLLEPHELPVEAAVRGFVDASAGLDRVARVRLAGARPHLLRVRGCDRKHAHGDHALVVEHGTPGHTVIRSLPDAAAGRREEQGLGRTWNTNDVGRATFEVRGPDGAPAQAGDRRRVDVLRRCGGRDSKKARDSGGAR